MNRGSPLALVVALVVCLAATSVGYVHAQPDTYTSTAVLSLSPRDTGEVGSDDLTLAASRYVAYLSAPATLEGVATTLGLRRGVVAKSAHVVQQPATVSLRISVTGPDATGGAEVANALARAGVRQSVDDPQVIADLIVPAVVPVAPSGPPRRMLYLVGGSGALCLGVLAILALGYLRPRVRTQ
ncbi:hypothetical protein [Cryptosporangium aurantiacum]|uniref:Capsular polysaccharide biosynthesis protein n=1 Tax=Cryptosporangium aurantiacum TaxID=134849 RepID=A0A1M7RJL3_9ACTN|nr:hypothetical protein [Cryptosporangium aurantiacum]SHN46359.1 Capsular polysaccharide biosynthesis protein [Cryptosporangium aurantiacum]